MIEEYVFFFAIIARLCQYIFVRISLVSNVESLSFCIAVHNKIKQLLILDIFYIWVRFDGLHVQR